MTGFAKRYLFHTQNLTHFLNYEVLIISYNCLKFPMNIATVSGCILILRASRDPPIMLIILPIMLCCTAQNFTYYAQIMPNYLYLSSHALLIISSLWINNKWLKHNLTCQNAYHRKDRYTLIEQSAM